MVLIWYATQSANLATNTALDQELADALLKIEEQLDKVG